MGMAVSAFVPLRKADLHVHLNGCIPTSVVQDLLREFSVPIPNGLNPQRDLQVTTVVGGLNQYFRPWHLLKLLPASKRCLDQMALSALISLAADGVDYVELRNSPFSMAKQNEISLEECLERLVDSLAIASAKTGIDARLIPSLSRFDCTLQHGRLLLDAIRSTNGRGLIVGVDLSGDEDVPVDRDLSNFFREAKEGMGLGVTIHAGETWLSANVEWAIKDCQADRIGHGLAAANEPRLLEMLVSRGVCIEVCLRSNILTGRVVSLERHPVCAFIASGVPFVLCSDNPSIHDFPLSADYADFSKQFPQSNALESMYDNALKYSFGRRRR